MADRDAPAPSIDRTGARIPCKPLPAAVPDAVPLSPVFQNLISNAFQFNVDRAPLVQVSGVSTGSPAIFEVRDNGVGIRAVDVPIIFQMSGRLKGHQEIPDSGIGLARRQHPGGIRGPRGIRVLLLVSTITGNARGR